MIDPEIKRIIISTDHGEHVSVFRDLSEDGPFSAADNYDGIEQWAADVLRVAIHKDLTGDDILALCKSSDKAQGGDA